MNNKRINYITDFARVTSKGIRFRGNTYSCSTAIREQWFELAQLFGGWSIQVYFNPFNTKVIYMKIEEEEEMEDCCLIEKQMFTGSKLEKYFRSIQYLKRIRQQSKTKANIEIEENQWKNC